MRSKRFLAAVALATAVLFAFAPAASAQEAEDDHSGEETTEAEHGEAGDPHAVFEEAEHIMHANDAHHADIECVEILVVEDGSVSDCRDAPNPLLPETNEIIWGAIGFTVVFLFLAKFGLPAAKKAMDERAAKIQGDLDAAEAAKADAESIKAEYAAKVADAKTESARIIEEARQAADQLKADQQTRLNEELATARASAQADIDAAKGQAMAELRGEVSDIAIGAAEAVVGANLDRAAQTQLIEDYINRVQAGN
ncbi:F0F1 ATP synthase subunit B [Actinospongicola halichondriae]|uniref:F0F1 ATP synthase subunit B n=1 Tax=Actinospongicola halichondriae TaxID=3236844 RepID=UPI003D433E5B